VFKVEQFFFLEEIFPVIYLYLNTESLKKNFKSFSLSDKYP